MGKIFVILKSLENTSMSRSKFWKRNEDVPLTKLEEQTGLALIQLENSSSDFKNDLKNLFIDSVKDIEIVAKNKKTKNIVLVFVPHVCLKLLQKVHRKLVPELEKQLNTSVLFVAKRTIQSKWVKAHKSQKRPFSRTLTSVHENILNDLVQPSAIIRQRIRCKLMDLSSTNALLTSPTRTFWLT